MKKVIKSLLALVSVSLIASCVSVNEVASEYLENLPTQKDGPAAKIYVCLPTQVVHTNQTLNQIDGFSLMPISVQDSIIKSETKLLNKLNDEAFMRQFSENLIYHLRRTGIDVEIVKDEASLPKSGEKTFVLNIPQIEAEEFVKKSRSEFVDVDRTYYHYDYDLKGFSTNVWFIFNTPDTTSDVYYKGFEIMDSFDGYVDKVKNNKASIKGTFKRINVNDVYNTAAKAGKQTAVLFVEKIINDYVRTKGYSTNNYYMYNPVNNTVVDGSISAKAGQKRSFQKIDNK